MLIRVSKRALLRCRSSPKSARFGRFFLHELPLSINKERDRK